MSSASSTTGARATTSTPSPIKGLSASTATIRHSVRSERTSSERRQGLPVVRGAPGRAGICVCRKWFAARRSSRTRLRQAPAEATSSGSPIPITLSAAPIARQSTATMPNNAIGSPMAR